MCYSTGKRHIGGEGRAHETGIPPAPALESSAPPSEHGRSGSGRCMTWAVPTQPPARPQTVTPGSTRGPTPTTVIARRETQLHPPTRQGAALPKAPHPSRHPRCACRGVSPRFQPWVLRPKNPSPVVAEPLVPSPGETSPGKPLISTWGIGAPQILNLEKHPHPARAKPCPNPPSAPRRGPPCPLVLSPGRSLPYQPRNWITPQCRNLPSPRLRNVCADGRALRRRNPTSGKLITPQTHIRDDVRSAPTGPPELAAATESIMLRSSRAEQTQSRRIAPAGAKGLRTLRRLPPATRQSPPGV
jgi:hypothetical protein